VAATLPAPLTGIIVPMVTPLRGRDRLDVGGLERLVEHILAGGVQGVFILGTSGEGPNLSHRLRSELVTRACRLVRGRVPVLVGITDTSFVEAVELARHAARCGARALVTAPPFYFPCGQPELAAHVGRLLAEIPLPLFLYNMPQMTKVVFQPQTLRELADHPGIAGIKDSSGDLAYLDALLQVAERRPDWSILTGPEHLLVAAMRRGAHGGVTGGANLCPRLFTGLHAAVRGGDARAVARLQRRVKTLGGIYRVGRHASAVVKGMKCALAEMGICRDTMSEPFDPFEDAERLRIRAILRTLAIPLPPPVA
jgi:4-hydroxy-tetrahydrodipicolinate synthase